ncbi:hypothetical protein C4N9_08095 [Pararhodobacter marinus]|uniref:GSCFA domain-containing protein n=3 Tax=Pararhodobacter marinus TaxID=2184063 RepID=A0A2U2CD22_9RHOB|nr:hypothetical protein C4N9_08095 [Pararhodobacter marinus]
MVLSRLPTKRAMANRKAGRHCRWPDGRQAWGEERVSGLTSVTVQPGFAFSVDDPIMTIGSCFAREIEVVLAARGFDLPALAVTVPDGQRPDGTKPNVILNKYSVHSMENEIRWAFEGPPCEPERFFLSVGDDLWHDPHVVHNVTPGPMSVVQSRRDGIAAMMRELPRCRVVVITLGLVESWFDKETRLYLNTIPPVTVLKQQSRRFELHVLDYGDVLKALDRIHALIAAYGHPEFHILCTVSPVPFKMTYTGQDAIVANTYGKSVQRAAAEVFAAKHENVDYFPSYEIVATSDRQRAYLQDNIHVTPEAVDAIMSTVLDTYCVSGQDAASKDSSVEPG